jgi:hypothetical protein
MSQALQTIRAAQDNLKRTLTEQAVPADRVKMEVRRRLLAKVTDKPRRMVNFSVYDSYAKDVASGKPAIIAFVIRQMADTACKPSSVTFLLPTLSTEQTDTLAALTNLLLGL